MPINSSFITLMNKMSNTLDETDKDKYDKELKKYINVYEKVIKKKGIYNYKIILDKLRNEMQNYENKKTQLGNNLVIVINGLITDIQKKQTEKEEEEEQLRSLDRRISDVSDDSHREGGGKRKSRKTNRKSLRKRKNTLTKRRYRK